MDNVLGIIAEYNPFHNGHLYHLQESKKITNSKYVVAVIGNNFTQRGDVSIIDKWSKAKIALANGVDLCIELPSIYSTSNAEYFAYGATSILNSLNIINYISFGSENGNIEELNNVLELTDEEKNPKYSEFFKQQLSLGLSYPKAKQEALNAISNNKFNNFFSPNNILAIEYLKSLKKLNSPTIPITIKRTSNNHINVSYSDLSHSDLNKGNFESFENLENFKKVKNIPNTNINENIIDSSIISGQSIRNILNNTEGNQEKLSNIRKYIPESTFNILSEFKDNEDNSVNNEHSNHYLKKFATLKSFEKEILYIFKKMTIEEIKDLPDVTEGLEYKIKDSCLNSTTLDEFIFKIKSKRFTLARIQRILIYGLLGITKLDLENSKKVLPYVRILGFTENGKELLSKISNKNPNLNIITSVKKFENSITNDITSITNNVNSNSDLENKILKRMLDIDIFSTIIHSSAIFKSDNNNDNKSFRLPNDYN